MVLFVCDHDVAGSIYCDIGGIEERGRGALSIGPAVGEAAGNGVHVAVAGHDRSNQIVLRVAYIKDTRRGNSDARRRREGGSSACSLREAPGTAPCDDIDSPSTR
jgi:hypothetical protein